MTEKVLEMCVTSNLTGFNPGYDAALGDSDQLRLAGGHRLEVRVDIAHRERDLTPPLLVGEASINPYVRRQVVNVHDEDVSEEGLLRVAILVEDDDAVHPLVEVALLDGHGLVHDPRLARGHDDFEVFPCRKMPSGLGEVEISSGDLFTFLAFAPNRAQVSTGLPVLFHKFCRDVPKNFLFSP